MQSAKSSVWAALGLLAVGAALVLGAMSRDRIERGSTRPPTTDLHGLVASTSKQLESLESDFFYQLTQLLQKEYVDPVNEDDKLASGAVRGMVSSLLDPDSSFMNPEQFKVFLDAQKGLYHGIGAEFKLKLTPEQALLLSKKDRRTDPALLIPDLEVSFVAPDGPAATSGLKVGDRIESVDGRWVLSSGAIREFRAKQVKVTKGQQPASSLNDARRKMRDLLKDAMTPGRAREVLSSGDSGKLALAVIRGGKTYDLRAIKAAKTTQAVTRNSNRSLSLRFFEGAADALKPYLNHGDLTLDLRGSGSGNHEAMLQTLALLAPSGVFGFLTNERKAPAKPMKVESGQPSTHKVRILVDGTTRGAAEVFALALASKGIATLEGPKMAGDRKVIEIVAIPGGSGYSLPIGIYSATSDVDKKRS